MENMRTKKEKMKISRMMQLEIGVEWTGIEFS